MSLSLDSYRSKLVTKILHACSGENAQRFVDTALKTLERHKVNGYIIARFIDKLIYQLESIKPTDQLQWQNIVSARTFLQRRREELSPVSI